MIKSIVNEMEQETYSSLEDRFENLEKKLKEGNEIRKKNPSNLEYDEWDNPIFVIPKGVIPRAGARVKDLQDPTKKMSKSQPGPGTILMNESPAEAAKKIKRAQTDSLGTIHYDPASQPGIANLLEILGSLSGRTPQQVAGEFKGQQYGALKNAVAEAVVFAMEPLQARYTELMNDKAELLSILKNGALKAEEVANATLEKVMDQIGYVRP